MEVREGMSTVLVTVGPQHTLRQAAERMRERHTGAALVMDSDRPVPGIVTERDVLDAIGAGKDPDTAMVADHMSPQIITAAPDWSLERAAEQMVRGGFRHLAVIDGGELIGVLSMRDIVRCWTTEGATSGMTP